MCLERRYFLTDLCSAVAEKYGYYMNQTSANIRIGGPSTKKLNLGADQSVSDKYKAAESFVARVQSGKLGRILLEDTQKMPRRYKLTQFDQIESNSAELT